VAAGLVSGLQALFDHFEVLGQRPTHRLLDDTLLDVRNRDDIFGRGRFRVIEHFIDQRQLAILDRQLLGAEAVQAVFEVFDAQLEQAFFSRQRPQQSGGFFERRRGWIGDCGYANLTAITLPEKPAFMDDY
jgi:hypothetical protein